MLHRGSTCPFDAGAPPAAGSEHLSAQHLPVVPAPSSRRATPKCRILRTIDGLLCLTAAGVLAHRRLQLHPSSSKSALCTARSMMEGSCTEKAIRSRHSVCLTPGSCCNFSPSSSPVLGESASKFPLSGNHCLRRACRRSQVTEKTWHRMRAIPRGPQPAFLDPHPPRSAASEPTPPSLCFPGPALASPSADSAIDLAGPPLRSHGPLRRPVCAECPCSRARAHCPDDPPAHPPEHVRQRPAIPAAGGKVRALRVPVLLCGVVVPSVSRGQSFVVLDRLHSAIVTFWFGLGSGLDGASSCTCGSKPPSTEAALVVFFWGGGSSVMMPGSPPPPPNEQWLEPPPSGGRVRIQVICPHAM